MTTEVTTTGNARLSIASIVAVLAAVLSFTSGAILGFIFAVVAIIAGIFGIIVALSPSIRGGIFSILAICAGVIGILAAIIKAFAALV